MDDWRETFATPNSEELPLQLNTFGVDVSIASSSSFAADTPFDTPYYHDHTSTYLSNPITFPNSALSEGFPPSDSLRSEPSTPHGRGLSPYHYTNPITLSLPFTPDNLSTCLSPLLPPPSFRVTTPHFFEPTAAAIPLSTATTSPEPPLTKENVQWRRDDSGRWLGLCSRCNTWVRTGSSADEKNLGPIKGHRTSNKCKIIYQAAELARAQRARETHFWPSPIPLQVNSPVQNSAVLPDAEALILGQVMMATPDAITLRQGSPISSHATSSEMFPKIGGVQSQVIDLTLSGNATLDSAAVPQAASSSIARQEAPRSVPSTGGCGGIKLEWPCEDIFQSYPWHRHGFGLSSLGYRFCEVERDGVTFRIRADLCSHAIASGDVSCAACKALTSTVSHLAAMAQHARPHTNHKYLTHEQLRDMLKQRADQINQLKLKALNVARKCATAFSRLDDYSRFVMAIATKDVSRVHILVRQCLKDKAGIGEIVHRLQSGIERVYHARSYDDTDLDAGLLALRLGGLRLVYAMNEHLSVPSLRTVRRSKKFTRLYPCIAFPSSEEVLWNMAQIFDSKKADLASPRVLKSGMSLAMDEVALEEMIAYFPHRDSPGGFAREDAHKVPLRLATLEDGVALARALADGTIEYGKEASVLALSSFDSKYRGAFPVLISPTSKREQPVDTERIVLMIIECWNRYGAADFGRVWTFASDGDAGRRAMVYKMFMKTSINETHPLWKFLGQLQGLNLLVGDDDITGDFDWKHELKRIGRLLRTNDGMMVGKTVINFEMLRGHLQRSGKYSDHEINLMLNPSDSQDVPRAIEFIQALAFLSQQTVLHEVTLDPSKAQEARVIAIIGDMFASFQDVFVRVDWSLTEQVVAASKCAHIMFILFRENRVNFMPNQLYGDMQTTIKNFVFCIAKQQEIDGLQPFYSFWAGDDRLEVLFGRMRMLGGHNPNFSLKDLGERAGAAVDIEAVFSRHPDWDCGYRRLKVTKTEHLDHLNPDSWKGNAIANTVHLESAWRQGQHAALETLRLISVTADFGLLFDSERTVDLMKPFGDGHYPGVANDPDRSQELPTTLPITGDSDPVIVDASTFNDPLLLQLLPSSGSQAGLTLPFDSPSHETNNTPEYERATSNQTVLPPDEDLEHVELSDTLEDGELDDTDFHAKFAVFNTDKASAWIDHNGRRIHKSSVCRLVINPEYFRKYHDRILRVRGYSTDSQRRSSAISQDLIDEEAFIVGDIFTTLIRCGTEIHVAVMKSIAIEQKGVRIERVKNSDLSHTAAGIRLTGQVFCMKHVLGHSESSDTDTSRWLWTGDFVKLASDQKSTTSAKGKSARKTIAIKLSSALCLRLNPSVSTVAREVVPSLSTSNSGHTALGDSGHAALGDSEAHSLSGSILTWELSNDTLLAASAQLWDLIEKTGSLSSVLPTIPHFGTNDEFPYQNSEGQPSMICELATYALAAMQDAQLPFRCFQCHEVIKDVRRIRNHVGHHILKAMRGVEEELPGQSIDVNAMPCGVCGRSGNTACQDVYLMKAKSAHPQARSGCQYFKDFKYKPSLETTTTTPCTNVPILCPLGTCSGTVNGMTTAIWKYNMSGHIRQRHAGYSSDGIEPGASLPADLGRAMQISVEEERMMGIPGNLILSTLCESRLQSLPKTDKPPRALKRVLTVPSIVLDRGSKKSKTAN